MFLWSEKGDAVIDGWKNNSRRTLLPHCREALMRKSRKLHVMSRRVASIAVPFSPFHGKRGVLCFSETTKANEIIVWDATEHVGSFVPQKH